MLRIVLAFLLLAGVLSRADAEQVSKPEVAQLAKVTMFAFGGVGFAGAKSAGEMAYGAIMSRPSREALLEEVFAIGTAEAKLYALVGLHNLNKARFEVLAAEMRSSKEPVNTAMGCIIYRTTVGAVIQRIDAGRYARYV